mmetsp:Transcript_3695/g.10371  ORF Transcript_3695/g.10371 Transcript_3695/m.10371 type:complete len:81 (-) Transcript_3695:34-276(-)
MYGGGVAGANGIPRCFSPGRAWTYEGDVCCRVASAVLTGCAKAHSQRCGRAGEALERGLRATPEATVGQFDLQERFNSSP